MWAARIRAMLAAAVIAGCFVFPASSPWNQRVDGEPLASRLGRDGARDRARRPGAPRLRLGPLRRAIRSASRTRWSQRSRSARGWRSSTRASPTRARIRSRARPKIEGGATATCCSSSAARAGSTSCSPPQRSGHAAGRRQRGDLQPALEPAAPAWLDERRRGRACRSSRGSRATTRWPGEIDHALRSPSSAPATRSSSPPAMPRRATDPNCRAMGQRFRLKASVISRRTCRARRGSSPPRSSATA